MKQLLLKKLLPIVETFADDLLKGVGDLSQIRKQLVNDQRKYQDLCEDKDCEVKHIKEQKAEGKVLHDEKITELSNAKIDLDLKTKNYEDLTNDLKAKKTRTEDNLAKSEIELIRAKEVRGQADDTLAEGEKVKADYELKLRSLKSDFDKIDLSNKNIDDEKKKLTVRENSALKNEAKNGEKAQELNELDRKIKSERAEVDRLIKLYKLKV